MVDRLLSLFFRVSAAPVHIGQDYQKLHVRAVVGGESCSVTNACSNLYAIHILCSVLHVSQKYIVPRPAFRLGYVHCDVIRQGADCSRTW